MQSAVLRAVERADQVFNGCESGMTPLPIGVGKKGMLWSLIKFLRIDSARAYAEPLPMMIRGAEEARMREAAA